MLALRRGDGRVPTHRGVLQADSQCHVLHPAGARSWGSDHAKRRSTTARQEILGRSGPIYGHGLTQRALDRWDSSPFSSIFLASSFFCSQAESTPAPEPVTQTVGRLKATKQPIHPIWHSETRFGRWDNQTAYGRRLICLILLLWF